MSLSSPQTHNWWATVLLDSFAQPLNPAGLAVPGIVAELLIAEEKLFASTKDELLVAICTR
jgi:hypothetical protein